MLIVPVGSKLWFKDAVVQQQCLCNVSASARATMCFIVSQFRLGMYQLCVVERRMATVLHKQYLFRDCHAETVMTMKTAPWKKLHVCTVWCALA